MSSSQNVRRLEAAGIHDVPLLQTSELPFPEKTFAAAYVGMTGVAESVIGVPKDRAIKRFLSQVRSTLGVAKGEGMLCGVVIEIDG